MRSARAASSLLVLALVRVAAADSKAAADETFERGRTLMAAHKYVDATGDTVVALSGARLP